jgi:hypothetical protein
MMVDNLLEIQQDSPLGSCQIVSVLTSQAVPLTTPSTSIYDSLPFQSTQEVATARDGLLSSPSGMLDAGWRKALDTMIKPDWGGSHGGLDGVTRRLRRARFHDEYTDAEAVMQHGPVKHSCLQTSCASPNISSGERGW